LERTSLRGFVSVTIDDPITGEKETRRNNEVHGEKEV